MSTYTALFYHKRAIHGHASGEKVYQARRAYQKQLALKNKAIECLFCDKRHQPSRMEEHYLKKHYASCTWVQCVCRCEIREEKFREHVQASHHFITERELTEMFENKSLDGIKAELQERFLLHAERQRKTNEIIFKRERMTLFRYDPFTQQREMIGGMK